jgi:hypothetical protein
MDSAASVFSAFSRVSLADNLTSLGIASDRRKVIADTDIFHFDKFVAEIFAAGLQILDEDEFEKIRYLGSGRTMVAYEGKWKSRSEPVALK